MSKLKPWEAANAGEHERAGDLPHLLYQRTPLGGVRQRWVLRAHGIVATARTRTGVIRRHRQAHARRKGRR